jgi:hypothetical protein
MHGATNGPASSGGVVATWRVLAPLVHSVRHRRALLALAFGLAAATAAAAQDPSMPAPATAPHAPWSLSAQVGLGFSSHGGDLHAHTGEVGLRLSRALSGGWRLGLALDHDDRDRWGQDATYLDLGIERGWDVHPRVRLVGAAGFTLARLDAASFPDQRTVAGGHAGFATEVRLGRALLLRPEVRMRALDAVGDARDVEVDSSLGVGVRF